MIDQTPHLKAVSTVAAAKAVSGETSKAAEEKTAQHLNASTTTLPKLVQLARALSDQGPPVDQAKIARVRQAIAEGNYHIDTDAIANAILLFSAKGE